MLCLAKIDVGTNEDNLKLRNSTDTDAQGIQALGVNGAPNFATYSLMRLTAMHSSHLWNVLTDSKSEIILQKELAFGEFGVIRRLTLLLIVKRLMQFHS